MVQPTSKNQGIEGKAQTVHAEKPEVNRPEANQQGPTEAQWQAQTVKNPDDFE